MQGLEKKLKKNWMTLGLRISLTSMHGPAEDCSVPALSHKGMIIATTEPWWCWATMANGHKKSSCPLSRQHESAHKNSFVLGVSQ